MLRSAGNGAALVVHGGGPTPVLNASLAGIIQEAKRHHEFAGVLGARFGISGLLNGDFIALSTQPDDVIEKISWTPGSALGSCRRGATQADYEPIMRNFDRYRIQSVIFCGGNGTMYAADQLLMAAGEIGYDLRVIGVPKTIDNDLGCTDHSPGYGSAARFVACAVRDIGGDLWSLRQRVTVVETMGRNAGWLVAASALARNDSDDPPHLIYLPERPVSADRIATDVQTVYSRLGYCVVAVCEGQVDEKGEAFGADPFAPDGFDRRLSANLGHTLAQLLADRLKLRTRSEKPGLLGRSSAMFISEVDRAEALLCGRMAVRALVAGENGKMVTLVREETPDYRCTTGLAPLAEVAYNERLFPQDWITPDGNDVTGKFVSWVKPLTGPIAPRQRLAGF